MIMGGVGLPQQEGDVPRPAQVWMWTDGVENVWVYK